MSRSVARLIIEGFGAVATVASYWILTSFISWRGADRMNLAEWILCGFWAVLGLIGVFFIYRGLFPARPRK